MAGDTNDNSITGITSGIPYLAIQSISAGAKIYWAKAFSLKIGEKFGGVQFSTDGTLLIAHSFSYSCFFVVINTSSGNILQARSYYEGGHWNYN